MYQREEVTFSRNTEAIMIPSGERVLVPEGAQGTITQSLGGAYTLITERGLMVRVSGKEVEAIGKAPVATASISELEELTKEKIEQLVWDQLKTCFDPEIPVNIVDLGLIYDLQISTLSGGARVDVKMTLTAQGCGMGTSIAADARNKILDLPGVLEADVLVVWDPPWTPEKISPEGRALLGIH